MGVVGNEDFGLDVYEPEFFATSVDWASAGTYKVSLKFDVADFLDDIFYFCHIHIGMKFKVLSTKNVEHMALAITSFPTLNALVILSVILSYHLRDVSKRLTAE